MHAIFRMCGNESQPGLQLVEKLAWPWLVLFYVEDGLCAQIVGHRKYKLIKADLTFILKFYVDFKRIKLSMFRALCICFNIGT